MKRAVVILLAVLMCVSFACCGKSEDSASGTNSQKAEITYDVTKEMMLVGTVKEVNGDSLLIVTDNDQEYVFSFSKKIKVVQNEQYVYNPQAADLLGKKVTAIAGNEVMETWPMMLTNERVIIITE